MAFELYVVESSNQMNLLLIKAELDSDQQGNEIVEAAVIGCRTLKQLADDSDFRRTVERMTDLRLDRLGSTTQEFKDILEDVDKFERFLCLEQEVLLAGGITADLAEKLVDQCLATVNQLKKGVPTPDEVFEGIRTLRDQACDRSRTLVAQSANTRKASEMESQLWKITMGLGGAALIGLNAAIAATTAIPSVGLTAAGAAVSAAFGGNIIKNATTTTPKTRTAGGA
jgi:hypothetical protein